MGFQVPVSGRRTQGSAGMDEMQMMCQSLDEPLSGQAGKQAGWRTIGQISDGGNMFMIGTKIVTYC